MIKEIFYIISVCFVLPFKLKWVLEKKTLENCLVQIENKASRKSITKVPPEWIIKIVRRCLVPAIIDSNCKCLFRSIILYYLLLCSKKRMALHFGCRIDDKIKGHCWLSSLDVKLPDKFTSPKGTQEVVSRVRYDLNQGALWQTSYSQTPVTETVFSVLREKKSSVPCHAQKKV